ncbi:hypothetical protein JCM16303_001658 [Sporobolomyces ruberrimus]
MTTSMLNHLLSHNLATNDSIPASINYVASVVETQRLVSRVEQEEGTNGPTLHRWQLRLVSLLAASNPSSIRTAGFKLLHLTFTSSSTLFLAASKQTLTSAQQVLATRISKIDPSLYLAAVETTKLIVAKSSWYPEWARENVGAQAVQRFVSTLVQAVHESRSVQVKLASLSTICTVLPLFPTALRPLSPSLHSLSLGLLCDPESSPAMQESASNLFVSLYLLAPKGKEGLREAWKTGVEALVASCDELVSIVSGGIFAEDAMTNHTLSPLALPPLPFVGNDPNSPSPFPALARLSTLSSVLLKTLRTPTTEKAGQVSIPLGAIVELSTRMISMSRETPIKERVDPTTKTLVLSLVPQVQVLGCHLIAQLGMAVGTKLVAFSNVVLGTVARTLSTYEVRSPMRPALSTTYALLVNSMSAHLDPNEASKSLSRVWRTVLEDISSVAFEPLNVNVTTSEKSKVGGKQQQEGRKNKRVKTSFDPSESMVDARAKVDETDLEIAVKGLETLERLLRAPISQFLPPALQLSTSRLLLYISLSPSFATIAPLSSSLSQTSTFYPASSTTSSLNSSPLEIVKQSLPFKLSVLRALETSVEYEIGGIGLEERSLPVWNACTQSSNREIRSIGSRGLNGLRKVVHPRLPSAIENENLERFRRDKRGGEVGADDDEDLREGVEEFRTKEKELREYREEEDEEVDGEDETMETDVRKEKEPKEKVPKETVSFASSTGANGFGSASTVTATSTTSTGGGFSSFQAPSFGSTITAPTPAPASLPRHQEEGKETPSADPVLSFSTETFTTKTADGLKIATTSSELKRQAPEGDSDSDDDDEMMPSIDLGSDGE